MNIIQNFDSYINYWSYFLLVHKAAGSVELTTYLK
jgi:hypothetical protein